MKYETYLSNPHLSIGKSNIDNGAMALFVLDLRKIAVDGLLLEVDGRNPALVDIKKYPGYTSINFTLYQLVQDVVPSAVTSPKLPSYFCHFHQ